MKTIKRKYYPGEEWIYFKIYTGEKTAETILLNSLYPLVQKLKKENKIQKYFFIRYQDPDFHIRFRMQVTNQKEIGNIIQECHKKWNSFLKNTLISQIDISTYNRELERYSPKYMNLSESIFDIDSSCILILLRFLKGKDENYRWLSALRLIDSFLNSLCFSLQDKINLMEKADAGYKIEFGYNEYNSKQLNTIYRNKRTHIQSVLNEKIEDQNIKNISKIMTTKEIYLKELLGNTKLPENNILSYIHMSMNRLFRNRNRIYELLIYNFLLRHYKSELAIQKKHG